MIKNPMVISEHNRKILSKYFAWFHLHRGAGTHHTHFGYTIHLSASHTKKLPNKLTKYFKTFVHIVLETGKHSNIWEHFTIIIIHFFISAEHSTSDAHST